MPTILIRGFGGRGRKYRNLQRVEGGKSYVSAYKMPLLGAVVAVFKPFLVIWAVLKGVDDLALLIRLGRLSASIGKRTTDNCEMCDDIIGDLLAGTEGIRVIPCKATCFGASRCIEMCQRIRDLSKTSTEFPCIAAGFCEEDPVGADDTMDDIDCRGGPFFSCKPKQYCRRKRKGLKLTCELRSGIGKWYGMKRLAAQHTVALAEGLVHQAHCGEEGAGPYCIARPVGFGFVAECAGHIISLVIGGWKSIIAIETPGKGDDQQWLTFWLVLTILLFIEQYFARVILSNVPLYYQIKLVILMWLVLQSGAETCYRKARQILKNISYCANIIQSNEEVAEQTLAIMRDRGKDVIERQLIAYHANSAVANNLNSNLLASLREYKDKTGEAPRRLTSTRFSDVAEQTLDIMRDRGRGVHVNSAVTNDLNSKLIASRRAYKDKTGEAPRRLMTIEDSEVAEQTLDITRDIGKGVHVHSAVTNDLKTGGTPRRLESIRDSLISCLPPRLKWHAAVQKLQRGTLARKRDAIQKVHKLSKFILSADGAKQLEESKQVSLQDMSFLMEYAAASISFEPRFLSVTLLGAVADDPYGEIPPMDRHGLADAYITFRLIYANGNNDNSNNYNGEVLFSRKSVTSRTVFRTLCPQWNQEMEMKLQGGTVDTNGFIRTNSVVKATQLHLDLRNANVGIWSVVWCLFETFAMTSVCLGVAAHAMQLGPIRLLHKELLRKDYWTKNEQRSVLIVLAAIFCGFVLSYVMSGLKRPDDERIAECTIPLEILMDKREHDILLTLENPQNNQESKQAKAMCARTNKTNSVGGYGVIRVKLMLSEN